MPSEGRTSSPLPALRAIMKSLALAILRGYKRYLSPALPVSCRYVPTCSDYAMEAIERNGILRGGAQAIVRFLRCNPWGGHGYDPASEQRSVVGASSISRRNGEA